MMNTRNLHRDAVYAKAILERKENGQDCTEQESAEIKGFLKEGVFRYLGIESGHSYLETQIQKHFPQEYGEAVEEYTTNNSVAERTRLVNLIQNKSDDLANLGEYIQKIEKESNRLTKELAATEASHQNLINVSKGIIKERDELKRWKELHENSSYGGILNKLQKAESLIRILRDALKSVDLDCQVESVRKKVTSGIEEAESAIKHF